MSKEARENELLVRAYENGYRQKPEDSSFAEALAATAAEILSDEDWIGGRDQLRGFGRRPR